MSLSPEKVQEIRQAKTNALCSKVMNTQALHLLRNRCRLVDSLGYAIPVLLIVATVVVLRTQVPELAFVVTADVLGGLLFVATMLKGTLGWQDTVNRHTKLLSDNMDLVRQADSLLKRQTTASAEAADMFLEKACEVEKQDLDVFGQIPEEKRRETYRFALREFGQDAHCQCGASPWAFQAGACQICGGTPVPAAAPVPGPAAAQGS
jgi:mobilome CxxCx(11)CxxC protein